MTATDGFHIAPFTPDGELVQIGFWETSGLSQDWLDVCRQFLQAYGDNFRTSWGQQLAHIETKLTSASGAGIGTFYANGELAISMLYLTGIAPEIEEEILELFVSSMRRVENVIRLSSSNTPFEALFDLKPRPLSAVVLWGNEKISDEDSEIIRELSLHFASAFFEQSREPS